MARTRVVRVDSEQYAEIMALREALQDAASAPDVLRTRARSRLRFLERLIADTRRELEELEGRASVAAMSESGVPVKESVPS